MSLLHRPLRHLVGALAATALAAAPAQAQVAWIDWTSAGTNLANGTMTFGGTTVGVTYAGPYNAVTLGCTGNFWASDPSIYTGTGVPNAPPNCELVQLSTGGTKTITFSEAVTNPVLALVSWNLSQSVSFTGALNGSPVPVSLVLVNEGQGTYGNGSATVAGNVLTPSGELHGTIMLTGTYTSISFTDTYEFWHGITVGAQGLGSISNVPEPSTYALMATGLLGVVAVARRRRA